MINSTKFIFSAGFIRVIAIIAVVSIHVTDALIERTNYFGGISWWFSVFINSISRIGVPLFVMLSGYLLLDHNKPMITSQFFKKTFFRIVIPLLCWSLIYIYFRHVWHQEQWNLGYIIDLLLTSRVFHLYYLFIILGLYILTPWLKNYLNKASLSKKRNLVIGALVLGFLITLTTYIFPSSNIIINSFTIYIIYTGYYIAGDLLRNIKISKLQGILLTLAVVLMASITSILIFFTEKLSLANIKTIFLVNGGYYFGEYLSLNIIIMSLCAFVLLLNIDHLVPKIKSRIVTSLVILISSAAFGVYLIHPIVIDLLDHYANFAIHLVQTNLWIYIIEKIFLVFVISAISVLIALKIPILNKLFGEK